MKSRTTKVILCALTFIATALSTAIGYGFMGSAELSFLMKFVCGFILIMPPLLVVQLIIMVYKK